MVWKRALELISPRVSDIPVGADAETLFRAVVENVPDMIFVKDAEELRFVLFNRAGEELLGIPRTELLGKNDYDFFPKAQADFFTVKDREILQSNGVLDIAEEPIDTRNGKRILHTKKIGLRDAAGRPRYLLGISEDITARKQTERRLAEQARALEHASKLSLLGEMAGSISHEINNPLAVICGHAEEIHDWAAGKSRRSKDDLRKSARQILKTADRVRRIVDGLRALARDSASVPVELFPIRRLFRDTLALCQRRFASHGVDIEVPLFPARLKVPCRPVQIEQVLLNLLTNAFDAVRNSPAKNILIELKEEPHWLRIAISDSGPGVPAELEQQIFQPYFTTKPAGTGIGLGLSISRGIVESHGGTLVLRRDAGRHAFVVSLPRSTVISLPQNLRARLRSGRGGSRRSAKSR